MLQHDARQCLPLPCHMVHNLSVLLRPSQSCLWSEEVTPGGTCPGLPPCPYQPRSNLLQLPHLLPPPAPAAPDAGRSSAASAAPSPQSTQALPLQHTNSAALQAAGALGIVPQRCPSSGTHTRPHAARHGCASVTWRGGAAHAARGVGVGGERGDTSCQPHQQGRVPVQLPQETHDVIGLDIRHGVVHTPAL